MIRNILQLGDQRLREISKPFEPNEQSLALEIWKDLEDTKSYLMTRYYFTRSAGLCAVQIGILKRLCLTWLPDTGFKFFANPVVTWSSPEISKDYEGCLSFFDKRGYVPRSNSVTITYLDKSFSLVTETLGGVAARILLHEIDHMDGILYFDRMEPPDHLLTLEDYQGITGKPGQNQKASLLAAELRGDLDGSKG